MSEAKPEYYGNQIDYRFFTIEKATEEQIKSFKCGNEYIDDFIHEKAIDSDLVVTYVWENQSNNELIAIASICCTGLIVSSVNQFSIYPAVEIKYFGVAEHYQDMKYSECAEDGVLADYILAAVEYEIINNAVRSSCGAKYIVLYSVPDAEHFYVRNRYLDFEDMFLKNADLSTQDCIPKFKKLD